MKDAFDKEVAVGDTVIYATRKSSSQYMHVARVLKVEERHMRVQVLGGSDYDWIYGKWDQERGMSVPFESYEATLRAPGNVVVANGIDAMGINARLVAEQKKKIEKRSKT